MTTQDLIELLQTLPPTATCVVRLWDNEHEILAAVYDHGEVTIRIDEPEDISTTDDYDYEASSDV